MSGEMLNACSIVAAAKSALLKSRDINFKPQKYEKHIQFNFLPTRPCKPNQCILVYGLQNHQTEN